MRDLMRDPNGFFSRREVCKFLGVSRWTLRKMIRKGHFPDGEPRSECLLGWRIADVYRWKAVRIEAKRVPPNDVSPLDSKAGGIRKESRPAKCRVKKDC